MDVMEKLVEILKQAPFEGKVLDEWWWEESIKRIAEHLIANGVTVQEHGYWETVVEVRDNTVCGNGVKIEYKRCSCCKNPAKFLDDDFCAHCGAKLDLPQPPKGE